ncbi:MAG TPA: hypothetical protein HPQ00_12115, partial [Magnetococcales bacterium]|nr:hypothetical protein [Magnetococcales bacterium]
MTIEKEFISLTRSISSVPLCTCWDFVTVGDIFHSVWLALSRKIRAISVDLPWDIDTIRLVKWDLRQVSLGIVADGFMLERSLRRFLLSNPDCRIIHMYENNPWERACRLAMKSLPFPRGITGYLHCAVLKSHLKNHIALEEKNIRPAPDMIVCSGNESRNLFLSLGAHDPDRVMAGCALRESKTTIPPRQQPPRQVKRVVVLFEGLSFVVPILRDLAESPASAQNYIFIIRGHPIFPAGEIARQAGVTFTGSIAESRP